MSFNNKYAVAGTKSGSPSPKASHVEKKHHSFQRPSLLRRKTPSNKIIPDKLSEDYVHRIFNTRAKERNTDATIARFLETWQRKCEEQGSPLPQELCILVNDQKNSSLRFGRLDLNRAETSCLGIAELSAFAKAVNEVPVVRTVMMTRHPHLAGYKTMQCFIEAMEAQLTSWTTMIPYSVQRRRLRAKVLLEKRVKERRAANKKKEPTWKERLQLEKEAEAAAAREDESGGRWKKEKIQGEAEEEEAGGEEEDSMSDMYLSGVAAKIGADGMPIFLLQEIKLADVHHTSSMFHPGIRGSALLQPVFGRKHDIHHAHVSRTSAAAVKSASNTMSEVSKIMVIANSELEARRLFHDFDVDGDGVLTGDEIHQALCSLGLSVLPEESKRLVEFISTNNVGEISEEDFVHVVAHRLRSCMVKKQVAQRVASLSPERHFVLHPMSPYMQSWDLFLILFLIFMSFSTPFEVAFIEPSFSGYWFWFNRVIDVVFFKDLIMHFFLMYPKNSNAKPGQSMWTITWERNHWQIAIQYLKNWFVVDALSCVPFDLIAAVAVGVNSRHEMNGLHGVYSGLRILRVLRLFRIAKLTKILRGGREFKRFEKWLSLRHTVAETVKVVVTMFFCAHWTACAWSELSFFCLLLLVSCCLSWFLYLVFSFIVCLTFSFCCPFSSVLFRPRSFYSAGGFAPKRCKRQRSFHDMGQCRGI